MRMRRASGGSDTPLANENDVPDLVRAMSPKVC